MKLLPFAAVLALLPTSALAHAGHDVAGGFAHPFTGFDHVLAMLAVGLVAVRDPAARVWVLPAVFAAAVAAGGALGLAGLRLPGVESLVAASVVVIGLLLVAGPRVAMLPTAALLGLAGLVHGLAHGAEMPAGGDGLVFAGGFLAATLLLHGIGILAGRAVRPAAAVAAGGAIGVAGAMILGGAI